MRGSIIAVLVCLLALPAWAALPTYHYQTGTSREVAMSGSGNTNVSSLVYVPSADKWLVSQQDCSIWVLDGGYPSDSSTTRTLGNCGSSNDIESLFLVDPYNERGFGDVLMAQSERGTQLCEYSLSGVLDNTGTSVIRSWDFSALLGIPDNDNNNEGIAFIPGDTNCSGSKHGGCYLVSLCQGSGSCDCTDGVGACGTTWPARTFVKFKIDSSENLTIVGSTFTLDSVCDGYLESDVAELQYDFALDQIYVLDDNTNAVCVLDGTDHTLATRVAGFAAPSAAQEGISFGRGLTLYANDTPSPPTTQDVATYKGSRRDSVPPWYDLAWTRRAKLVIDHTKIPDGSDLTNFPLLVMGGSAFANSIQADGGDILFTTSGGMAKLTHEITSVDSATGAFQAWVKVPTLYDDAATTLYVYFGNASAANQFDATGAVWGSEYVGVYHLEGSDTTPDDASGTGNHLSESGDPTEDATGKIGRGVAVVRSSSILTTPYGASHNFATTDLTICAWFELDSWQSGSDVHVFAHGSGGSVLNERYYWREEGSGARLAARVGTANPTDYTTTISLDTWYRACVVADASNTSGVNCTGSGTPATCCTGEETGTCGNYSAYLNATLFSTVDFYPFPPFTSHAVADWTFGGAVHATNEWGEGMTGTLDEIWIRTSVASNAQLTAEYNNQSDPSSFYALTYETSPRRHVQ